MESAAHAPFGNRPLTFVYGTLKQGLWNHGPWMQGLERVAERVWTPGQVRLRRTLTPILDAPWPDMATPFGAVPGCLGTSALASDLGLGQSKARPACALAADAAASPDAATTSGAASTPGAGWVEGELHALDSDPTQAAKQLARLDELEEFFPDQPTASWYERVLVPVLLTKDASLGVWAWAYRIPGHKQPASYPLAKDPTAWQPELELPEAYFAARQNNQTPPPLDLAAWRPGERFLEP